MTSFSLPLTRIFKATVTGNRCTRSYAPKQKESGAGRSLTFHPDMESLLRELKSEIPTIPDVAIFEFVYEASRETIQELQSNSECRPTATGTIKQTRLATEGSRCYRSPPGSGGQMGEPRWSDIAALRTVRLVPLPSRERATRRPEDGRGASAGDGARWLGSCRERQPCELAGAWLPRNATNSPGAGNPGVGGGEQAARHGHGSRRGRIASRIC